MIDRLTHQRLEETLNCIGLNLLTTANGDFAALFKGGERLFYRIVDTDVLSLTAELGAYDAIDEFRLLSLVNEWNRTRRWPAAWVSDDGVVAGLHYLLPVEVSDAQLETWVASFTVLALEFGEWLANATTFESIVDPIEIAEAG